MTAVREVSAAREPIVIAEKWQQLTSRLSRGLHAFFIYGTIYNIYNLR